MSNDPTKNAIATLMQLAVGSTHKNMNIKLQVINTNSNFKCSIQKCIILPVCVIICISIVGF